MADYYEYSIPELIKLLGARFKDYRLRSKMTQKDVSEQSGITITTIHKFENGTSGNMSWYFPIADEGYRPDKYSRRTDARTSRFCIFHQVRKEGSTN